MATGNFYSVPSNQLPSSGTVGDVYYTTDTRLLYLVIGDNSLVQLLQAIPIPVKGDTGPVGPKGDSSFITLTLSGAWNAFTQYAVGNIVTYNGFMFVANVANAGNIPVANPFWTALGSIGGGAVSSVFTRIGDVVAASGDYAVGQVTGAAPLASPALTGAPTAPTPAPFDNSTKLATTAYVDKNFALGVGITGFRDDFIADVALNISGAASQAAPSDTPWRVTRLGASGTVTLFSQDSTFNNPGTLSFTTDFINGGGIAFYKSSASLYGAIGSSSGWEFNGIFRLSVDKSAACLRWGLVLGGQQLSDPPTNGVYVEYDVSNVGNTDAKFTWVSRVASVPTYSVVNAINADLAFHHFRIRSIVAGTILFSVDGGTETSMAISQASLMTLFFQIRSRGSITNASAVIDFMSYMATPART